MFSFVSNKWTTPKIYIVYKYVYVCTCGTKFMIYLSQITVLLFENKKTLVLEFVKVSERRSLTVLRRVTGVFVGANLAGSLGNPT